MDNYSQIIGMMGFLSYLLFVLAFVMNGIVALRLLSIFSSLFAIIYFIYYERSPLWIDIIWESLFTVVNIIQIIIIIRDGYFINLTEEEKQIQKKFFPDFSNALFKKILTTISFINVEKGNVLIEQGSQVLNLNLIYEGLVSVSIDGKIVAYCKSGSFIGEMSFISGKPATATVTAMQPTKCMVWDQKKLQLLLQKDLDLNQAMQTVLNKDLVHKLTSSEPKEL